MIKDNKIELLVDYSTLGWKIFPIYGVEDGKCLCENPECERPGKHPMTLYLKDATSEITQIAEWQQYYPKANWAVATGAKSGIIVLDVDPNVVKNMIILGPPLPDHMNCTFSITGGGGMHFFFSCPVNEFKWSIARTGFGVDILTDGGYAILPPSMHCCGNKYRWKNSPKDVKLVPLTDSLVEYLSVVKEIVEIERKVFH